MGCSTGCKREFQRPNFGLNHETPDLFATSQWCWPPVVYLIYCVFWMTYKVTWIILSGTIPYAWYSGEENRVKWFVYLTNWAYFVLVLSLISKAVTAIVYFVKRKSSPGERVFDKMTWYLKVNWFLYSLSFAGASVSGIAYWALIVPYATNPIHVVDIHTHGISLVYLYTDVFVTAIPVRVYHVFIPLLFGVFYMGFTLIFCYAGGTNAWGSPYIYSGTIDWVALPGTTAMYVCIVVFVAVPLLHFLLFGLYKLRTFLHSKCTRVHNGQIGESMENVVGDSRNGQHTKSGGDIMEQVYSKDVHEMQITDSVANAGV